MPLSAADMRVYMRNRYHARKAKAIERLGGRCVSCGSTEALEFDHIDPALKSFDVLERWSIAAVRFLAEVDKCQLLCETCHKTKHEAQHGTLARYSHHGCRCEDCCAAWSKYHSRLKLELRLRHA